ncbi:Scr1 family TA system antitoxin-like transcriptional regulator [Streptomyces sp. ADI93-02]|uniref:Scr1 family TA system antitoxin-like transcriptional regulator n=1 Tax=Streptomyces sp. ADI93-02 TaxID=1522757 RepID=UPI000F5516BC|nr:Scr1 family TA system antitoxin-like transcriptional regulator [Streptomyces sp. ADI93-02]RPK42026.1 hypothetical protein EES40_19915 [Streptomyces sp. ADI93-02]
MVCAVIDESVLRRSVGGHEVRIGQLKHMQHLAPLRSTTIQVLPMACEDHSALEGPFILLTPGGGQQLAYLEVRSTNRLVTDAEEVRIPAARYGSIRGQALSPHEPLALIEELSGER